MKFATETTLCMSGLLMTCLALAFTPAAQAQADTPLDENPATISASDWDGIQRAREDARHRVVTTTHGFQAYNPRQGWLAQFDGRGLLIQPGHSEWAWGLDLISFGFEGHEQPIVGSANTCTGANRVAYTWKGGLEEWYVNDSRGLEHGYTLLQRPTSGNNATAPLVFRMAVRGALHANVLPSGRAIHFLDSSDRPALRYEGLHVYDARGQELEASFAGSEGQISILIDDSQATYPITIDPIVQDARLRALEPGHLDKFGWSVSVSGDRIVVGAPGEDSSATGLNGNQYDNGAIGSGAAYVFFRQAGAWQQEAYLKASNTNVNDHFGYAVSISGDVILVGAHWESSSATGVDGDQANNAAHQAGAAYIFRRTGGVWMQEAYLKASHTGMSVNNLVGDRFGSAVSVSGDLVVVGAPGEESTSTGVNGDDSNDSASRVGAAYVFQRIAGIWSQTAYLKASNAEEDDLFGTSVSASGSRILVGAPSESSGSNGVNGSQGNTMAGHFSGAAYLFRGVGSFWGQEAYIKASNTDANDHFASAVAISGDRLVIGAPYEDSASRNVNGDQSNNSASEAGAAYVYRKQAGIWMQEAYLKASNTDVADFFGRSVAIAGNRALVGADEEDGGDTGINGNGADNSLPWEGAAYLFEAAGAQWIQEAYVKFVPTPGRDHFGWSVAISEDWAVSGAFADWTGPQGSGSTYVYDLHAPVANYCGQAMVNSSGNPASLSHSGSLSVASNSFTLHANQLPLNNFGYFLNSQGQAYTPFPGGSQGILCLGGGHAIGRHHASLSYSGASGNISYTLDLTRLPKPVGTHAVSPGETWNFQCWHRDQNPSNTSNFTNGLSVQFE